MAVDKLTSYLLLYLKLANLRTLLITTHPSTNPSGQLAPAALAGLGLSLDPRKRQGTGGGKLVRIKNNIKTLITLY